MKPSPLAALTAALALATAAAPALACARPGKEVVTGIFPRVMLTYAPWEMITLDDPAHGRQLELRVAYDPRLAPFESFTDADVAASRRVRVTLERDRGEKIWHLVRVDGAAAGAATRRP